MKISVMESFCIEKSSMFTNVTWLNFLFSSLLSNLWRKYAWFRYRGQTELKPFRGCLRIIFFPILLLNGPILVLLYLAATFCFLRYNLVLNACIVCFVYIRWIDKKIDSDWSTNADPWENVKTWTTKMNEKEGRRQINYLVLNRHDCCIS